MEQKEIEKPWCAYGIISYTRFEKIDEERGTILGIRKTERQKYELLGIEEKYVKRFETLEEAVKLIAKSTGTSEKKVMDSAQQDFPSYFENKSKN